MAEILTEHTCIINIRFLDEIAYFGVAPDMYEQMHRVKLIREAILMDSDVTSVDKQNETNIRFSVIGCCSHNSSVVSTPKEAIARDGFMNQTCSTSMFDYLCTPLGRSSVRNWVVNQNQAGVGHDMNDGSNILPLIELSERNFIATFKRLTNLREFELLNVLHLLGLKDLSIEFDSLLMLFIFCAACQEGQCCKFLYAFQDWELFGQQLFLLCHNRKCLEVSNSGIPGLCFGSNSMSTSQINTLMNTYARTDGTSIGLLSDNAISEQPSDEKLVKSISPLQLPYYAKTSINESNGFCFERLVVLCSVIGVSQSVLSYHLAKVTPTLSHYGELSNSQFTGLLNGIFLEWDHWQMHMLCSDFSTDIIDWPLKPPTSVKSICTIL